MKGTFRRLLILSALAASPMLLSACSSQPDLLMEMDSWDLVFISASNGWGVAEQYAAMIEDDIGIPVTVHDLAIGSLSAGMVLEGMDGEGMELYLRELPELLPEAEVVVVSLLDPKDSVPTEVTHSWNCMGPGSYVNECPAEPFEPYFDDMDAIFAEIFEARNGQPTIVRAFDIYNFPDDWQENDVYDDCLSCYRDMLLAGFYEVTGSYNVPTAHVFESWSEPDFTGSPREKGYIGDDGIHPSEAGEAAQAQMLRELGYEPTEPDR